MPAPTTEEIQPPTPTLLALSKCDDAPAYSVVPQVTLSSEKAFAPHKLRRKDCGIARKTNYTKITKSQPKTFRFTIAAPAVCTPVVGTPEHKLSEHTVAPEPQCPHTPPVQGVEDDLDFWLFDDPPPVAINGLHGTIRAGSEAHSPHITLTPPLTSDITEDGTKPSAPAATDPDDETIASRALRAQAVAPVKCTCGRASGKQGRHAKHCPKSTSSTEPLSAPLAHGPNKSASFAPAFTFDLLVTQGGYTGR
jgi:hypothetical protein